MAVQVVYVFVLLRFQVSIHTVKGRHAQLLCHLSDAFSLELLFIEYLSLVLVGLILE